MHLCTILLLHGALLCPADSNHMCGSAGCDALSVHLILTVIAATLSIGISWKAVVGSLGIMIPWQLAHWEEYHTGQPHAVSHMQPVAGTMLPTCSAVHVLLDVVCSTVDV